MNLSDLIAVCGEDVHQQWLDQNLDSANIVKKNGKITFFCPPQYVRELAIQEPPDHVCLILWLPRNKVAAALATIGKEDTSHE